jgi:hypothetical protein
MNPPSGPPTRHGIPVEAVAVACAAAASAALVLGPAVALLFAAVGADGSAGAARHLSVAIAVVAGLHAVIMVRSGRRWALGVAAAAGLAAGVGMALLSPARHPSLPALCVVVMAEAWTAGWVAERLRAPLSGALRRRPLASAAWAALGLLLVVQSARLSTFMADPTFDFWVTSRDPVWAQHMCMPAYVEGADLLRQGAPNIYDSAYYPAVRRSAKPSLTVRHMEAWTAGPRLDDRFRAGDHRLRARGVWRRSLP